MNFPLSKHDVYKLCMQISTTGIRMCVWMDECSWWAASWKVVTATSVCMCVNGWMALHKNAWEPNHMLSLQDSKASFGSGFTNPVWKCHLAVLHAFISFCPTVWLGPFASICLLGCLLLGMEEIVHLNEYSPLQTLTEVPTGEFMPCCYLSVDYPSK